MEPTKGFEPLTCCLRNSCSATELRRHHAARESTTFAVATQAPYTGNCVAYRSGGFIFQETAAACAPVKRQEVVLPMGCSVLPRSHMPAPVPGKHTLCLRSAKPLTMWHRVDHATLFVYCCV